MANCTRLDQQLKWGRSTAITNKTVAFCYVLLMGAPLFVIFVWDCVHNFGGSLMQSLSSLSFSLMRVPQPTAIACRIWFGWMVWQIVLYVALPGKRVYGLPTPAGHRLVYYVNGLTSWSLSVAAFLVGAFVLELFPPEVITLHWEGLLAIASFYGFGLTLLVYVKAHLFPTHSSDRKFSNSYIYDFFMGIELNPRLSDLFDFKLFHNGRPGIIAWTLINISFASAQFRRFGSVTTSMLLVNYFQALYVIDFFSNESWYIRTIDIAHDHFGFYLAWGDSVWLPMMYTLQAQFLSHHNVQLSSGTCFFIWMLGTTSCLAFRVINHQKDYVRANHGNCFVWGKKATFIDVSYESVDGHVHRSLLLTCGFWGLARHCNYLADILLSLSMCLCCGTSHALPYFYVVYMIILLCHRINRDDERCQGKYGEFWTQYKKEVPYKIVPFVY